jgi:HTH-type transcriptional regulator/antitoxin HigA
MKKKAINRTPVIDIIKDKMKIRGMSQAELANLTRISTPVINDILQGRRGLSAKQIVAFALVLGVDAIELGRMQSDQEIMSVISPMIMEEEQ